MSRLVLPPHAPLPLAPPFERQSLRAAASAGLHERAWAYVELTKPRIALLVLLVVAVTACCAAGGLPAGWVLANTLLGTALVAASASSLNQWLERSSDARMPRTAARPLPSGRLTSFEVLCFGAGTAALGLVWLAVGVSWITALYGLATWLLYVWVYTPLKYRTAQNTAVGAVAGALPVLIGYSACAPLDLAALALFMLVYLWQFPHFMAIAWLYRQEYATAGIRMLPVVDGSGRRAARQAVVAALALVPVACLPAVLHGQMLTVPAVRGYFLGSVLLGGWQFASATAFAFRRDERTARWLLRASLIYLPAVWLLLLGSHFG